jgi:UDP-N-acetylmuramoyl-L-alanine---L-glutamate ligase
MKFSQIQDLKTVLIIGLGLEGQSPKNLLEKEFKQLTITMIDYHDPSIPTICENFDMIVVSAGYDRNKLPKDVFSKCTSSTELFFDNLIENNRLKIIGITGSKGKSTTTKFTYDLLKTAGYKVEIGGNYGKAVTDFYYDMDELDFLVLELSSYQLEFLQVSPHFSIFLNLYNAHLDRHGSMEEYFKAKQNIFTHQLSSDYLFVANAAKYDELAYFKHPQPNLKSKLTLCNMLGVGYFLEGDTMNASHIRGNIGCVYELSKVLGISEELFKKTCVEFKGLEHRMEFVAEKNGVTFVNDSIATLPDAALMSVKFFGEKLGSIIVGGQDNGYDYGEFLNALIQQNVLIGVLKSPSGDIIQSILKANNYSNSVEMEDFEALVAKVASQTKPGFTCLLATGTPSFGYFKDYKERGERFKSVIGLL